MYKREQVAEEFLKAVAKAFMGEIEYYSNNLQLNMHSDLHTESVHLLVIGASMEEEFDLELDIDDFLASVTTLESGIDYVYSKVAS